MGFHLIILCSYASLFFITPSSPMHSLASYHKLKNVSLSLCPLQDESTTPQCLTIIEKLAEIRANLIDSSIKGVEGEGEEGTAEEEDTILDVPEDQELTPSCIPGEMASILLTSLREVSTQLSDKGYDKHYLILLIFFLLLIFLKLLAVLILLILHPCSQLL